MVFVGAAVAVGVPLVAFLARSGPSEQCALDGLDINATYCVRIVEASGDEFSFCCLHCARAWLARRPSPQAVWLTDETTGQALEARRAWLVRSRVVTQPYTGNRIHCFARREDASRHAQEAQGVLLSDTDRISLGLPPRGSPHPSTAP
jgi:hypothetical protein